MTQHIGFIGLGAMGKPMARNLLKAGYALTVHNRSRAAVDELAAEGASSAWSPAEVAAESDIVITMLPDSPDVEAVVLGPDGVLSAAREGVVIIDMSTISPRVAQKIGEMVSAQGRHFLDAPVSGGESGAIAGSLSIMVGGDSKAFEQVRPILESLGKTITYVGPSGSGQTAKLCNQVICVLNILAVSEALTLGKKAGLNLDTLMQVVSAGSASSWMLSNLGPKMIARDWRPGFKVDLQQKDLRLVEEFAQSLDMPLLGATLVRQLFRAAQADGHGSDGTQTLITVLEKLANLQDGCKE
jgi:3-hydroxyisobutyrate dehydrogenase